MDSIVKFAFGVDFGIQLVGFVVANLLKTEIFYDAFGSLAYLSVAIGTTYLHFDKYPKLSKSNHNDWYQQYGESVSLNVVAAALVCVWATRLGSFLLYRVIRTGHDSRFDKIKKNPIHFFVAWMMQGLWVCIVTCPLVVLNIKPSVVEISINKGIDGLLLLGLLLWSLGFLVECIADYQKLKFKLAPGNRNQQWMDSGLWSFARYPNYFGEMTLWWGFFAICTTGFDNKYDYLTIISPIFVMILLLFVR